MRINKNTWHYWLYKDFHKGCPPHTTNLCAYFWTVAFWGLASLLFGAVLIACFVVIGIGIWERWPLSGYILLAVLGIIGAIVGIVFWREQQADKAGHEPSLLLSYLRAKKQKICPTIEFVEREKEGQ